MPGELFTRLTCEADLDPKARRWTGNDDSDRHHHAAIRLTTAPIELLLSWKATGDAKARPVGAYRLWLPALLEAGYIRHDEGDTVRLRFVHNADGYIAIQTNDQGPSLIVGKLE